MQEHRRVYWLHKPMTINDRLIQEVVIDSHVDKHIDHINDELILEIVQRMTNKHYAVVDRDDEFIYFLSFVEHLFHVYRVVWLLENNFNYIGIITIFRDRKAKKGN